VALLKQVKGVGTLIALTLLLTPEDPHRFRESRDVGCYLGLQPGRRNSGQSEPQMHISKEGDPYLRTLLVCVFALAPKFHSENKSNAIGGFKYNRILAPKKRLSATKLGTVFGTVYRRKHSKNVEVLRLSH
jgi:transposase